MRPPLPLLIFILFLSVLQPLNAQHTAYDSLERRLGKGWNSWSYGSMLTQVLLPQGLAIQINFRNAAIGTPYDPNYFLDQITVDRSGMVKPIAHSFDGAYTELIVDNWFGNTIRVQTAARGEELVMLVTPLRHTAHTPFWVELQTGMMWNREGTVIRENETIKAAIKDKSYIIRSTHPSAVTAPSYTTPYLACMGDTTLGFYTGAAKTLAEVQAVIDTAQKTYEQYAQRYTGRMEGMPEAFKGIESVLGWNTLYDAEKDRVITPVTRGWNEAWQGYVLFEWDTYFASFLFALDNKDLAYSNAIAVTRGLNKDGAVGFTQMPRDRVSGQSQPPVGSLICWMIYEKYRDKWFLEEVYPGLLSWNRWWIKQRVNKGFLTWGAPWANATLPSVILESGLDNSPMYEDTKVQQAREDLSLLNLADVGLNSLYAEDCRSLARIAKELGKSGEERELLQRAGAFARTTASLWDDTTGLYLNRYLQQPSAAADSFSHRLSPTLFYPMLASIPTAAQAKRMIRMHYNNPQEFAGEYIIPSCARNDKRFNNDYWRGAIWGPMNFLVYLGLRNYDRDAAAMLAGKSYALFLRAWKEHYCVFENINSDKGVIRREDNHINSDPFYHWGALMGIMQFMEENRYK